MNNNSLLTTKKWGRIAFIKNGVRPALGDKKKTTLGIITAALDPVLLEDRIDSLLFGDPVRPEKQIIINHQENIPQSPVKASSKKTSLLV